MNVIQKKYLIRHVFAFEKATLDTIGIIIQTFQLVGRAGKESSRVELSFEHFDLGLLIYERA